MKTPDGNSQPIAVIGAGVVGLCTALELIRSGHSVYLFDAEPAGSQASFGNAAYLAAEYIEPLASIENIFSAVRLLFSKRAAFKVTPDHRTNFLPWSLRFLREAMPSRQAHNQLAISRLNANAIEAWQDLLRFARAQDDLRQSGYLRLYENPAQLETARKASLQMAALGFEAHLLQGEALKETEPLLSNRVNHALHFPASMQLGDTYQSCQHLLDSFLKNGGQFEQQKVQNISPSDGGVKLILQGKEISFSKVVIAAGAWSQWLLESLGLKIPLAAERGYHLTLPKAQGRLRHMLSSADRNVVLSPLDVGLRIVGFSEFGSMNSKPVEKRYRQLAHHLQCLLTEVDPMAPGVQQWMGIRPTLPDSLPVIDLHPGEPRIGMVFGHQHLGVTQAAISARLISELIIKGQPDEAWRPFADVRGAYRISRF